MADPDGAPRGRLSVVTLNIWGRRGDWPARREVLVRRLAELDPDVVGLQEVESLVHADGRVDNQVDELAARLDMHTAYGVSHSWTGADGVRHDFGNAVLSRFPVSDAACFPLPKAERDEPRSVLACVVQAPRGPVPVLVTHLAWRLEAGADRLRQVRELVGVAERRHPTPPDDDDPAWAAFPPVLLADLNAEPESDELRYLTGLTTLGGTGVRWADAWRYGGAGPGYTYDPENPCAASTHEHARRIDYVLVRGPGDGGAGRPCGPRLAFTEPENGVYASDHFGVAVELETT